MTRRIYPEQSEGSSERISDGLATALLDEPRIIDVRTPELVDLLTRPFVAVAPQGELAEDLVFDHIDDLLAAFALTDHSDDADLGFIVQFLELAAEHNATLLALTKEEAVPLTIELLRDCDGDEEELIESLSALWTWLGSEGAQNAAEIIEATLDLDPSAHPRVHPFRRKKA